jgi:uncharacterized membrane protein
MKFILTKSYPYISLALLTTLILSIIYYPSLSAWIGSFLLISGLGFALYFIIQKHIQPYKQKQITRSKFISNVLVDLLGLIITIFIATYLGGMAGAWASQYGVWAGLVVGLVIGFASAWGVRKLWAIFLAM